jgi:hypothetical protein
VTLGGREGRPEAVAGASHGLDERRPEGVDLLAQEADVGLNQVERATRSVDLGSATARSVGVLDMAARFLGMEVP